MPEPRSPVDIVIDIRRYVPSAELYRPDDSMDLAGHWAWPEGGGLAGADLFLLRDGTYLHTHWADVMPRYILSRGAWAYRDGWVELSPESQMAFGPVRDGQFVPLTASVQLLWKEHEKPFTLFLGTGDSFEQFLANAEDGAGDLLLYALTRQSRFSLAESQAAKTELLANCWQADRERSKEPPG